MWIVFREFLVNLGASAIGELSSPSGMMGYLVALGFLIVAIVGWHSKRMLAGKRGVDSWYFIGLAMVVAAVAIGGAAYGVGLRSALAVKTDSAPASAPDKPAHIDLGRVAPEEKSVLIANRYYSAKNKEEVAGFLDKISDAINKTGNQISEFAEIAINKSPWDRPGEDIEPFVKRMDDISALTVKMHVALYDELLANEREYRVEMNALLFPKEPFTNFQIGGNEFRDGLSVWKNTRDKSDNADRNGLLQLVMASRMNFDMARDKFVAWMDQRRELIEQARRALRS